MTNLDLNTTEYEAKFYPVIKDEMRVKLKAIGAVLKHPERRLRMANGDKSQNSHISCSFIRLRDEGNVVRLSAKTTALPGGALTDQKELDVKVEDYEKALHVLTAAGFTFHRYQEKLRETWNYDGADIEIDTWPGLKPYIEIEASSEDHVRDIASKLGCNWEDKIITPVTYIFIEEYGITKQEALKRLEYHTFENNCFHDLAFTVK